MVSTVYSKIIQSRRGGGAGWMKKDRPWVDDSSSWQWLLEVQYLSFNTFFRFSITNKNFKYLNTLAPKLYCKSIFSCIPNNVGWEKDQTSCLKGMLPAMWEGMEFFSSFCWRRSQWQGAWHHDVPSLPHWREVPGLEAPTTAPWHILSPEPEGPLRWDSDPQHQLE